MKDVNAERSCIWVISVDCGFIEKLFYLFLLFTLPKTRIPTQQNFRHCSHKHISLSQYIIYLSMYILTVFLVVVRISVAKKSMESPVYEIEAFQFVSNSHSLLIFLLRYTHIAASIYIIYIYIYISHQKAFGTNSPLHPFTKF